MINKLKNIIRFFLSASNEKNIFVFGSSHLALAKFNYEKIGDILVKGKAEPITIYFPAKSN